MRTAHYFRASFELALIGTEYLTKAGQAEILYGIKYVTPNLTLLFLRKCFYLD